LRLSWDVRGLSFWERWGWLILILLGLMLAWWVLSRYRNSLTEGKAAARPVEDMVPCAHCGK